MKWQVVMMMTTITMIILWWSLYHDDHEHHQCIDALESWDAWCIFHHALCLICLFPCTLSMGHLTWANTWHQQAKLWRSEVNTTTLWQKMPVPGLYDFVWILLVLCWEDGYMIIWIWMFPKIGVHTPKWMVKIMENPIKMGWFGGFSHIFGRPPIWWYGFDAMDVLCCVCCLVDCIEVRAGNFVIMMLASWLSRGNPLLFYTFCKFAQKRCCSLD